MEILEKIINAEKIKFKSFQWQDFWINLTKTHFLLPLFGAEKIEQEIKKDLNYTNTSSEKKKTTEDGDKAEKIGYHLDKIFNGINNERISTLKKKSNNL